MVSFFCHSTVIEQICTIFPSSWVFHILGRACLFSAVQWLLNLFSLFFYRWYYFFFQLPFSTTMYSLIGLLCSSFISNHSPFSIWFIPFNVLYASINSLYLPSFSIVRPTSLSYFSYVTPFTSHNILTNCFWTFFEHLTVFLHSWAPHSDSILFMGSHKQFI